jgi:hypothetical protein
VVEEWEDSSGGGYGLLQPQHWPLGLGPSGEIEVLYPLMIVICLRRSMSGIIRNLSIGVTAERRIRPW